MKNRIVKRHFNFSIISVVCGRLRWVWFYFKIVFCILPFHLSLCAWFYFICIFHFPLLNFKIIFFALCYPISAPLERVPSINLFFFTTIIAILLQPTWTLFFIYSILCRLHYSRLIREFLIDFLQFFYSDKTFAAQDRFHNT